MRRVAMLILFALLAVAVIFAQNPGNANSSQSTVPPTQNGNSPNTNPDQSATPATNQNNPPANPTTTQPPIDQTNPTSNSAPSQSSCGHRIASNSGYTAFYQDIKAWRPLYCDCLPARTRKQRCCNSCRRPS